MKIETEYNVGDILWVPRVLKEKINHSIVVDGKTYWLCDVDAEYEFKPLVKKKVISSITIDIDPSGIIEEYWGHNADDPDALPTIITCFKSDNDSHVSVVFKIEEQAMEYANQLAAKGEYYYG